MIKLLTMLKVAIVGCGKISDVHVSAIQRIPGCKIVGVCDKEELMAKQLCYRFPIKHYFSDLNKLLDEVHPDVVHITTPPQSHFEIAKKCLERGCHVFVEKPFTLNTEEARKLINLANKVNRKLTVGHDAQFSDVARRMRRLVKKGYLGGVPVHIESFWCYDLGDTVYAKAILGDKQHWVRLLPGGLLHNIISHGIAKIAEFLTSENFRIIAYGFMSPFLKKIGEKKIVDELRVIISEDSGTTAYFTFSTQMRPSLHQFHIYGPKNGIIIDEDKRTLIKLKGDKLKSYAEHFLPPINFARQYIGNFIHNAHLFLTKNFHMNSGLKQLIEYFYKSIIYKTDVPIPYREILLTSKIMDSIFKQINDQQE